MPIKIIDTGSLREVEDKIRAFEAMYGRSSDEFVSRRSLTDGVSEFDAIEWNFLLLQKTALSGDDGCRPCIFSSRFESRTAEVNTREMYEDVAA